MRSAAVCTFLALALAACSRNPLNEESRDDVVSSTTVTGATVERSGHAVATFLDDNPMLTRRVEAILAADPDVTLSAGNVNVTSRGDTVTLSGSVPDYATRDALAKAVSEMSGIAHVYNDVQVAPLRDLDMRESDENIAFSLQRSLVDQPRVTIEVVRGVVRLRGEPSGSKQLVERIALRTPGVRAVVSDLSEPPPPDSLVQ